DGIRDSSVTGVQTCALPISMAITVRTATITVTDANDSGTGSSTFIADYSAKAATSGMARGVYPTGYTPTPTATPCPSVGSWTEQAPYPIVVSGNAVASQSG